MIDAIDTINLFNTIIQPNIKFLGILFILIILSARYLETNILIIISILVYIFNSLNEFKY